MQNIVIYQDEGVGEFGLSCLLEYFRDRSVRCADAGSVLDCSAFRNTDLFVMPGGADLPYCRKLNGPGNNNIRRFVEDGGTYLGICAGAYYACRNIEFHKGRTDEICEPRELAFIDATAYGSLPELAPWYDDTLHSAAITTINGHPAFYYGGCAFRIAGKAARIIGRYDRLEEKPAAIIDKTVGLGRVILSGIHIEIDRAALSRMAASEGEKARQQELLRDFGDNDAVDWKKILTI